MFSPEIYLSLAHDRQREWIAEAEQGRLLAAARQARRSRRRARRAAEASAELSADISAELSAAGRDRPAGTVAPCGPAVAQPAR
jgi:hypothetical protein